MDVNKQMLGDSGDSKTGILDIRAKFNDGEDCDIELQVQPYKYMYRLSKKYIQKVKNIIKINYPIK